MNNEITRVPLITTFAHPENYGVYLPFIEGEKMIIMTKNINRESWNMYYNCLLNLLKDGIDSEIVQTNFVTIVFEDDVELEISIPDLYINMILWYMLVRTNTKIMSRHIFFVDEIKNNCIKDYIDKFLIEDNRKTFSNRELNNIIDDTLCHFHDIDNFAMYLANTVNLEDNVFLMERCPEFYQCMHADLTQTPIEDVKHVGMQYANRAIDIMKHAKQYLGYDHCLADACRASEGVNPKQFKEFTINIGTKPDGHGGIFPQPIYTSFINGGVASPIDYFTESSTGRIAQIIKYNNVGTSGHFARLLGLNNMDSHLYHNSQYDCCSHNFVQITIKDKKMLKMLRNRYYRLHPRGIEYILNVNDIGLIGKTIYLRSPITCISAARGEGVCYKCYGDLAYTVYDEEVQFGVNIGRIASETLSSSLTQKLLSAKHLLETFIEKVSWTPKFNELFEIEGNVVKLTSELDTANIKFVLDPDSIELENEEDDDLGLSDDEDDSPIYNEYIVEFEVLSNKESFRIFNDKNIKLYITNEFNNVIRRKGKPVDERIHIEFNDLTDIPLFIIPIENNELSKTLNHLEHLLNKNSTIKGMNIHQLLQALLETVIEGGLNIASTHLEIIVSNQVRDADDILKKPRWHEINPRYEILALSRSLTCNPSVTISMSFQKVGKLLYNPLTYKKNGTSFMDLFFMTRPQLAINGNFAEENTDDTDIDSQYVMTFDDDQITSSQYYDDVDETDE